MAKRLQISFLKGPVTVAYRREGKKWLCTALEFDILGIGRTRKTAFQQMRSLVNEYLADVLKAEGPVEFFNHSAGKEWTAKDKEYYKVVVALAQAEEKRPVPQTLRDIQQLRHYRDRIRGFDLTPLVPVGAA